MAPKRQPGLRISASPTKATNGGQKSLESFFKSQPAKSQGAAPTAIGKGKLKAPPIEIIDVDLDDDEVIAVASTDHAKADSLIGHAVPQDFNEAGTSKRRKLNGLNQVSNESMLTRHDSRSVENSAKQKIGMPVDVLSNMEPKYPDLHIDPLVFDTSLCPWTLDAPAPYSFLSHTFVHLSSTRSRILLVNTLVNTLRLIIKFDSGSLLATLYLLSNSISPSYDPLEMNIGPSILSKAIKSVSGLSSASLKKLYNSLGDPGDVAFEAKSSLRTLIPHPPLGIQGVYDSLLRIALSSGSGAAKQKQSIVERLLVSAKGEESRYLMRTLAQHIRVGAVRTTMISALARALVLTRPDGSIPSQSSEVYAPRELVDAVLPLPETKKKKDATADPAREAIKHMFTKGEMLLKRVFVQHPNYQHIVHAILHHGFEQIAEHVPLTVGVPLLATLGSPTRSLDEIYERLGDLPFTAEFKYDGQRVQVHGNRVAPMNGSHEIKLFSRHLENMTEKYPDIVSLANQIFENSPDLSSFILDAEIVAVDPETGDVRSFQELSNRPKKDVYLHEVKVSVCVYLFDLMYLNSNVLLSEPFRTRRDLLRGNFPPYIPEDKFTARLDHVESCESSEGRETVEEFFQSAVLSKSEGLMVKLLDSGDITIIEGDEGAELASSDASPVKKAKRSSRKPLPATYEPDKRTSAWLKLKKDYVQGLCDSFDLVPVGAWHGNGRKSKWWSPVLLAIRDEGRLVAVCKCMSGFTDVFYQAMAEKYKEGSDMCSRQPFQDVEVEFGDLRPSLYFKPAEVWEIQGADITVSPRSVAALGLVSDQRGLSIRFPRFIRTRDDKGIEDATGPDFLAELYRKQEGRGGRKITGGVDEGDLVDIDLEGSEASSEGEI